MENRFQRCEMLYGSDNMEKLKKSHIAVFGAGGVGGYIIEALVRSGIGEIDIIDMDTVSVTNLNRQIIATENTIGRYKTEVCKERALSINPDIKVNTFPVFFTPENSGDFDFKKYTYVADAVDNVTAKIEIAVKCTEYNVPVISSMGTGNKVHPEMLEITDIYKTSVCPLARVMRYELRKRNIPSLKVLYSKEVPIKSGAVNESGKAVPGSTAFVPAAAGILIASEIVRNTLLEARK